MIGACSTTSRNSSSESDSVFILRSSTIQSCLILRPMTVFVKPQFNAQALTGTHNRQILSRRRRIMVTVQNVFLPVLVVSLAALGSSPGATGKDAPPKTDFNRD